MKLGFHKTFHIGMDCYELRLWHNRSSFQAVQAIDEVKKIRDWLYALAGQPQGSKRLVKLLEDCTGEQVPSWRTLAELIERLTAELSGGAYVLARSSDGVDDGSPV